MLPLLKRLAALTLLTLGPPGRVFNVGSDEAVSIRELAARIHQSAGMTAAPAVGAAPAAGRAGQRYVPSIALATRELALRNHVPLDEAIARSLRAARADRAAGTTIASS